MERCVVKETKVKGGRLETRDGEPVKVDLADGAVCPLVKLFETSQTELVNIGLDYLKCKDGCSVNWCKEVYTGVKKCDCF